MRQLLRIGELAAQAGVSPRTVDYYTQLGLLRPAERTDGGFRMYEPAAVDVIGTIRQLESHGIHLNDMTQALNAETDGDVSRALAELDVDLTALRDAVAAAAPHSHAILELITARAHALITAGIEIINSPLI
ncbi:MerR family transcriptional regulator [Pilimelia columellifera]|uniref:HTH merR-type domain-containing protein n=1 Tax=Pilimelia columellifera subsp. columellifera TaxID=706583 RepID=A0ABP6A612_9ACTN